MYNTEFFGLSGREADDFERAVNEADAIQEARLAELTDDPRGFAGWMHAPSPKARTEFGS